MRVFLLASAILWVMAGAVIAGPCATRFEVIAWPGPGAPDGEAEALTLADFEGGAVLLTERDVIAARARFDGARQPAVSFRLSSEGAHVLARHSAAHVGTPIAMVFDGRLITAPVLRAPILGGRGMISGLQSAEAAAELAELLASRDCVPKSGS